jgi:hypothetical protein
MTEEQRATALELRSTGMTISAIARQLDCPLTTVWKLFQRQKSKPKPKPEIDHLMAPMLLPPMRPPSSIPGHRVIRSEDRNRIPLTKTELHRDFVQAWRNTSLIVEKIK